MYRHLIVAILLLVAVDPAHSQSTPLARYPGFGHNPAADEARHLQDERERASLIAECMRAKGFTYHATVPLAGDALASGTPPQDPNEAYFVTLPQDRQREYNVALYGTPDPDSEEDSEDSTGAAPGVAGCRGQALQRVPGVFEARSALAEEFVSMRRRILEDPRLRPTLQRWSTCMWQRGEHHPSPEAMMRAADDIALAKARGNVSMQAYEREWERAEPVAETCFGRADVERAITAVRSDYEQSFVQAHKELLDAFLNRQQNRNP
jgi:hypothetical protein